MNVKSRWGKAQATIDHEARIVTVTLAGRFDLQFTLPLERLPLLTDDEKKTFEETLSEAEYEVFRATQGDPDAPLNLPFTGTIIGDGSPRENPLPNVASIDLDSGHCRMDSGAHLDFWAEFYLPKSVLPRAIV